MRFISQGSSCSATPGRGHALALVDQSTHQVAEVGSTVLLGEFSAVRQLGERGYGIHRSIEDEFGPLRGAGVGERFRLEATGDDEIGATAHHVHGRARGLERAESGSGVETRTARACRCGGCRS